MSFGSYVDVINALDAGTIKTMKEVKEALKQFVSQTEMLEESGNAHKFLADASNYIRKGNPISKSKYIKSAADAASSTAEAAGSATSAASSTAEAAGSTASSAGSSAAGSTSLSTVTSGGGASGSNAVAEIADAEIKQIGTSGPTNPSIGARLLQPMGSIGNFATLAIGIADIVGIIVCTGAYIEVIRRIQEQTSIISSNWQYLCEALPSYYNGYRSVSRQYTHPPYSSAGNITDSGDSGALNSAFGELSGLLGNDFNVEFGLERLCGEMSNYDSSIATDIHEIWDSPSDGVSISILKQELNNLLDNINVCRSEVEQLNSNNNANNSGSKSVEKVSTPKTGSVNSYSTKSMPNVVSLDDVMASTGATTVTGSVVSGLPSTNDKTNDKIDNKDKNDDKNNNTNKDNIDNKDNVDDKDNNNTNTDDTGVDNADRNDTNADNGNSNNNNVSPDNGNNQGNNGNSSGGSQPTVSKRVNGGSTGYGNTSSVSTGVNGAVTESSTVEVADNSDTIDAGLDEDFSDFGKNKTYETVTSTNKVKQTSDKSTGSFVVPAIIGIGVAGALGVAGARYVKNKKGEQYYSDDDNFFSENDFSDSSDSQDETVSATDKKKGNSKYHAGSVNGLVLDEVNDADIKISNTDSREENTLDFE